MATEKATVELADLNDDELIGLIVSARREAQRRGIATEAEAWAAALADDERTRIARQAAEREAGRIAEAEQRRIAEEAAAKVRRESEAKRAAEEADAAAQKAAKVRALAMRARELFGSDEAEFKVEIWEKSGDKRVYIGHGYDGNWVEYYHTGNARVAPGTLKAIDAVVKPLAACLDVTTTEARERIKRFCVEVCDGWKTLRVEASPDNAPRDPACRIVEGWAVWDGDGKHPYYLRADKSRGAHSGGCPRLVFPTRAEAAAAAAELNLEPKWQPVEIVRWIPFPPKVQG